MASGRVGYRPVMRQMHFTTQAEANALISEDPFALIVGLAIYQQVPTEKAFTGPLALKERLGGHLDPHTVVDTPPDQLEAIFREQPAIHRFPANMAKRVQAVSAYIVDEYEGDTSAVWDGVGSAEDLMTRLQQIPGFGEYKARVALGVLAQNLDVRPSGYEEYLPDWPSIVDIRTPEDLAELSDRKKAWKASTS